MKITIFMCKMAEQKNFTITKKIAKHGPNSIIVIPKVLQGELRPRMVVEINIKVLEGVGENVKDNVNNAEVEGKNDN